MINLTVTPGQLQILKEAIDYHVEGFSGEDDQVAYDQAKHLQQFINYKVNQSQQEVTTEQFLDILFEGDKTNG
jgi:hypothetical protein